MAKTEFEVDKDRLEVRLTRVFEATPKRMWQAFSEPDQLMKWWHDTKIDTFEFKVGGKWQFVSGDNGEHVFRGEYKEIEEPRKIVRTFEYVPFAGHILTETVTFEALGSDKTLYKQTNKFADLADLEGMVKTGMEKGSEEGLNRLARVVES